MFVDQVELQLSAGKGGNGIVSWRREKYIPKGGPAGGDGGKGGSVYFEADSKVYSLEYYRNRRILKAKNGMPGGRNNCKGKSGADLVLKVPLGTLLKSRHSGEILVDFTENGQRYEICRGGKGGFGNSHFKTSTHQAPYICTEGREGTSSEVELELKLIADIGFVGMPNAGKSTLISQLAHIPVKIAPYPFTTLRPNLGILQEKKGKRLLIADIPGIIQNAHQNRGLGYSFLRHIERTSALLYVIELAPFQERDPFDEFLMLREELKAYDPHLLKKPFAVVLNKIDQEETEEMIEQFKERYPFDRDTLFETSATQRVGLSALQARLFELKEQSITLADLSEASSQDLSQTQTEPLLQS